MENNFLKLLNDILGEYSDVKISAITGIERTRINRIRNGKFKIELHELQKIISLFYVDSATARRLYDAYLYDKLGPDKYRSRQIAKEFLAGLRFDNNTPNFLNTDININININNEFDETKELTTINSLTAVRNAKIMVLLKAQSNGEKIRIISAPNDNFLISELFTITSAKPELEIDHIYSLASAEQLPSPLTYYISAAKATYPIFMLNTNYKAYYNTSGYSTNELMPFHIITGEYSMSISADSSAAVLSKNNDVVKLHSKIFDDRVKQSASFIKHIETTEMYLQHYCSIIERSQPKPINLFYSLDYEPCVLSFLTQNELELCMRSMKGNDELLEVSSQFVNSFFGLFIGNRQISFFTKKGLRSFLETGKIEEVPESIGLIVPHERRLEIIKIVLEKIKNPTGKKIFFMLNENEFDPPLGLRFLGGGYKSDHLFVISNDKDGSRSILSLSNPETVSVIFDFMESLPESNMVYPKEETAAYIEKLLSEYNKS